MPERLSLTRKGTNLSRIAGFNETVLIDAIRRSRSGLSRVELTALSGLSAQTVSNICRRMIDSGLLIEGERIVTGMGKPRTLLSLNPLGQYAIGVHLDPLAMTFVVLDFTGEVVAHSQVHTPTAAAPDEVIRQVSRAIDDLVEVAGVDHSKIAGIGFASPGPIDIREGVILDPPHLPGWRNVPLVKHLRETTELPVVLDKDVIAAAVGERWAGATVGYANSMFIYLGTGVGVGVTVDDAVVRGFSGNAGDIGHLLVDPDGPLCNCGLHGCLGDSLSPASLVQEAAARGIVLSSALTRPPSRDPEHVNELLDEFCAQARRGEGAAVELLERAAGRLAKTVSTLVNLFDSEVVALGGPTWSKLGDEILPRLPDLVQSGIVRGKLGGVRIVGTKLGEDVVAVGAACLVLDRTFSPTTATFRFSS